MILTPIPPERLPKVLRRFRASLPDAFASAVFGDLAATSAERAEGECAEHHRRLSLALARQFGMDAIKRSRLSWDGRCLCADTEAFVLLHEVAHFQLASPERRCMAGGRSMESGCPMMYCARSITQTPFATCRPRAQLSNGGWPPDDRVRNALECISDESYSGKAATGRRRDRY